MYHFCTYFDHNYLPRAMCLYRSLERHCPDFRLYALCMDDDCCRRLTESHLPRVVPIRLADFERDDPELLQTKANRSRVEYYYTCSPCLPLYLLEHHPEIDLITYCDADLYFFADPTPVLDEMEGYSIGIIEHRFTPRLHKYAKYGTYNVGWLSFRRDNNGLACLRWWRERCIEWCYSRNEDGKFADQGYLNDWPERFCGVRVIEHKGGNVAPWNVGNYVVSSGDKGLWVDDQPLLFYHFAGLKQLFPRVYDTQVGCVGVRLCGPLRRDIYAVYIKELNRYAMDSSPLRSIRNSNARFNALNRAARRVAFLGICVLTRSYIILPNDEAQ